MPKLETIKAGVTFVACVGVGKIVSGVVENNVPTKTLTQKVTVMAGKYVLGTILGEVVRKHIDEQIESAAARYRELKAQTETE